MSGHYAVWTSFDGVSQGRLRRRDLDAGVTINIEPSFIAAGSVAANGDVVYAKDSQVYRFRDGVSTQLTTVARGGSPITDGVNVVYQTQSPNQGHLYLRLIDMGWRRSRGQTPPSPPARRPSRRSTSSICAPRCRKRTSRRGTRRGPTRTQASEPAPRWLWCTSRNYGAPSSRSSDVEERPACQRHCHIRPALLGLSAVGEGFSKESLNLAALPGAVEHRPSFTAAADQPASSPVR